MWIREHDREKMKPFMELLKEQADLLKLCQTQAEQMKNVSSIVDAARARALHIGSECITDIGNIIIDACAMRDPSSYTDILTVLADEGVVDRQLEQELLKIMQLRKNLVHEYVQLPLNEVRDLASVAVEAFYRCEEQMKYFSEHE